MTISERIRNLMPPDPYDQLRGDKDSTEADFFAQRDALAAEVAELEKRAVPEVPPGWYPVVSYYRLDGNRGEVRQTGYQRPPAGPWKCEFQDRWMVDRRGEGATPQEAIVEAGWEAEAGRPL